MAPHMSLAGSDDPVLKLSVRGDGQVERCQNRVSLVDDRHELRLDGAWTSDFPSPPGVDLSCQSVLRQAPEHTLPVELQCPACRPQGGRSDGGPGWRTSQLFTLPSPGRRAIALHEHCCGRPGAHGLDFDPPFKLKGENAEGEGAQKDLCGRHGRRQLTRMCHDGMEPVGCPRLGRRRFVRGNSSAPIVGRSSEPIPTVVAPRATSGRSPTPSRFSGVSVHSGPQRRSLRSTTAG